MATKLIKSVSREMLAEAHRATWIVTLEPGDEISFRAKGRRTRYTASLHGCLMVAMFQFLQDDFNAKMADFKAGRRKRKPKAPKFTHAAPQIRAALRK
jgi:hypothetical protein